MKYVTIKANTLKKIQTGKISKVEYINKKKFNQNDIIGERYLSNGDLLICLKGG